MNRKFYVYEHWRSDKEECFYVGKGSNSRAYDFKHRGAYHKAICAKLARMGMCAEVRLVASELTEDEAFSLEKERVAVWREAGSKLANQTNGGEGPSGLVMSDERKEQIRKATIAAVSKKMKGNKRGLGFKHTADAHRRISLAKMGNKNGKSNKGRVVTWGSKISATVKRRVSEETKANSRKGAESLQARLASDPEANLAHRQKLSEAVRLWWSERKQLAKSKETS